MLLIVQEEELACSRAPNWTSSVPRPRVNNWLTVGAGPSAPFGRLSLALSLIYPPQFGHATLSCNSRMYHLEFGAFGDDREKREGDTKLSGRKCILSICFRCRAPRALSSVCLHLSACRNGPLEWRHNPGPLSLALLQPKGRLRHSNWHSNTTADLSRLPIDLWSLAGP